MQRSMIWVLAKISILFCCFSITAFATPENFTDRPDVQHFVDMMVSKYHFNKEKLLALFAEVKVRPQVIQSMNKPLEKKPWSTYQTLFVSEWRIKHGVDFWKKYEASLKEAEKRFGVPASIIVATIGIETRYGERVGEYRVIDSLSNLAFSDSKRAKFFKQELAEFFVLCNEQHLDPLKVMGSYAGAIGQPQFMPSSYRYYAINFSKSGQTDLMHNEVDVIGSIANYYQKHGWTPAAPIAAKAMVNPQGISYLGKTPIDDPLPLAELSKKGITPINQANLNHLKASVIELDNITSKEYWLGFHNFDVIKRYNASDLYAMAVYQLSDLIAILHGKSE